MSNELANLFAKRFIQRTDVKAVQYGPGVWAPHTTGRKKDSERIPWRRSDLLDHLDGTATYGHYLLDNQDRCKLFAFDVDLAEAKPEVPNSPVYKYPEHFFNEKAEGDLIEFNPRQAWKDRSHPARPWIKFQLRSFAHLLAVTVSDVLEIPTAVAYSGSKGVHVYGLTGTVLASDARDGAEIVTGEIGDFEEVRGNSILMHPDFDIFTVEVFPKQTSLEGKDLGNLLRLPLGKNLKNPKDPTFFVDMTAPMGDLVPVDPEFALTTDSPWKRPGE